MPPRKSKNKVRRLAVVPAKIATDEEHRILAYVQQADDDTLACRQKHDFPPIMLLNGRLPKDLEAIHRRDGSWRLKQYCKRSCGYWRFIDTLPGGILKPADVKFEGRYDDPTYLSHGTRIPARYCVAEMWRRVLEELQHQEGPPEVRFSGGAS